MPRSRLLKGSPPPSIPDSSEKVSKSQVEWDKRLRWIGLPVVLGLAVILRLIFLATHLKVNAHPFYLTSPPEAGKLPSEKDYFLKGVPPMDSQEYEALALNLLKGRGFSWSSTPPFEPNCFRTPGYPLFIAVIYKLAGARPIYVAISQILLSLLIIWLIFSMGRKLWNSWVGFGAAILFAIDPNAIFYSALLMADTLYPLLLLVGIYLLISGFSPLRFSRLFGAGILLGLSALVKPVGLYLPVTLSLLFLISSVSNLRQRLYGYLVFWAGFLLLTVPWVARNYVKFRQPIFTSLPGHNLLLCNAAPLLANVEGIEVPAAKDKLLKEVRPLIEERTINAAQASIIYGQQGLKKILDHPFRYAYLHLIGGATALLATKGDNLVATLTHRPAYFSFFSIFLKEGLWGGLKAITKRGRAIFLAVLIEFLIVLLCYLSSIYYLFKSPRAPEALVGALFFAYFLLVVGPAADSRFRLSFVPYLYLLGMAGGHRLLKGKQQNR